MKAIIFYCIDNFGEDYKFVSVCESDKVLDTINRNKNLSTEIVFHEVVDVV